MTLYLVKFDSIIVIGKTKQNKKCDNESFIMHRSVHNSFQIRSLIDTVKIA